MRTRLIPFILVLALILIPVPAAAQTGPALAFLDVNLWPEYDQPSMLVIYDFQVAETAELPARVDFHIPAEGRVIAVAAFKNGDFVNAASEGPLVQGEWQVLTVVVEENLPYRIEYYQPLTITPPQRQFSFLWYGDHAVEAFNLSVQQPVDAVDMTTDPPLEGAQETDGLIYYKTSPLSLKDQEQFSLNLQYNKSTDRLTVPSTEIQPSAPLDSNTNGRASLTTYLPYIIGALGLILVVGGLGYNYLWKRAETSPVRRRRRTRAEAEDTDSEVYCHQCGQRARPGDRFCRTCGTRLRLPPES